VEMVKREPARGRAFHPDGTLMGLHDGFDDGGAETCPRHAESREAGFVAHTE